MLEVTKQQSDATDDGIAVKVWGTYRLASHNVSANKTEANILSCYLKAISVYLICLNYLSFILAKQT